MKFEYSKESGGNDYMFGINSPSINSKHFLPGSSQGASKEIGEEKDLPLRIPEIQEEPEASQPKAIRNNLTLEKKLQMKVHKICSMEEGNETKENKNQENKNSLFKITGKSKGKKNTFRSKFKEKLMKEKNKQKNPETSNLNKKFYDLPQSNCEQPFKQVPTQTPVQANLYGTSYLDPRGSLGFGQFQSQFGYPGIYMNPIGQFPCQEGASFHFP